MAQKYSPAWRRSLWVIGWGWCSDVWVGVGECSTWNVPLFSSLSCGALRCLLARLAVDPIIDLIFLFVEQVFAGHPFLVGFLRLQRYGFLVCGGGCGARGLFRCLFYVERVCVLVLSPCRCLCVVACVSRGMEGCGEWLLARARTIILRLLHRALSSIKVLRYRVPSSPICPLRRDT